jgi:catechol 2,3-dioxygenase-like lactoylglutathione lyase family enzyme
VLRVRDQKASERFYREVLGCSLDHVNEPISLVQLRFGEHLIDLLPSDGEPVPDRGLDHFCLSIRCADLPAAAAALRARGVKLEGDVVQRRGAFGTGPSLYLRDPDGYMIELKPRP